jgi:hypothetical protein
MLFLPSTWRSRCYKKLVCLDFIGKAKTKIASSASSAKDKRKISGAIENIEIEIEIEIENITIKTIVIIEFHDHAGFKSIYFRESPQSQRFLMVLLKKLKFENSSADKIVPWKMRSMLHLLWIVCPKGGSTKLISLKSLRKQNLCEKHW